MLLGKLGFQNSTSSVNTLDDVLLNTGPIGVTLNGHGVRSIEGPLGLPFFANFYEIFLDHIGNTDRLFKKYGPIVKTNIMGKIAYATNDPAISLLSLADIKDNSALFVGDTETANWKAAHKFIPPAMSWKAVRHYTPMMEDHVRLSFKIFDELDASNEAWNVYPYMIKMASGFIGQFMLGMDFHHMDFIDAPMHSFVVLSSQMLHLNKKVSAEGAWYASLPFGNPQKLRIIRKALHDVPAEQVDIDRQTIGSDLPIQDAAIEAKNDRLRQELVDHAIDEDTIWIPELSNDLPFFYKFIKETQRLHYPSFQPARTSKTEVILPGGYRLPADSILIASLYGLHTNSTHWSNPQRFDQDRWDTDEIKNRAKGSYLPFATGPRGCTGFNLASPEVKVVVPELVYRNLYVRAMRRTEWPKKSAMS
ncbi:hypothetical protein VTL71DRAFT_6691 [Oculimacula yallundae]|uniref:Cytochrome P450 n=1 Tax=Oculimacula yallundae TaxID=86028 RepID=A0ABR4BXM9_9HELO